MIAKLILVAMLAGLAISKREHADRAINNIEKQAMLETNEIPKGAKTVAISNGAICDECQWILQKLKEYVNDMHNLDEMEQWIKDNICDRLQGALKDMCEGYAENLIVAVHYLNSNVLKDPMQTCKATGMCGTAANRPSAYHRTAISIAKVKFNKTTATGECDDCKLIVAEMHSLLKDKTVTEDLKSYFLKMCSYLPGSEYQHLCREYVNSYWSEILMFLEGFLADPEGACKDLGMCPSAHGQRQRFQFPRFRSMPANLADTPSCLGCRIPLDFVINFLRESNDTQWEIVKLVQNTICKIMPHDINLQCKDFLQVYGSPSLMLTFETINGTMVCEVFKACDRSSTSRMLTSTSQLTSEAKERGIVECETCRHLLQWIGGEMQSEQVQTDVVHFLQQLCDKFARQDKVRATCRNYAEVFVPYVVFDLGAMIQPNSMCQCAEMIKEERVRDIMELLAVELKIGHFCRKMKMCPEDANVTKTS